MENKSKLFGAFSSKLTTRDKEADRKDITRTISRDQGIIRSKDNVYKKMVPRPS